MNVEEGTAEDRLKASRGWTMSHRSGASAVAQVEAGAPGERENEVRLAEEACSAVNQSRKEQPRRGRGRQSACGVDSLDARIAAAREQVHVAERQTTRADQSDNTIIRAPFSGIAILRCAAWRDGFRFSRRRIHAHRHLPHRRHASFEVEVDVTRLHQSGEIDQSVTTILNAYPDWDSGHVITTIPAWTARRPVLVRNGFEQPTRASCRTWG